MDLVAFLLCGMGWLLVFVSNLRFLVLAYRWGTGWLFGCLVLSPVALIFFLLNLRATWRLMLFSLLGLLLMGLGQWLVPTLVEFDP